MANLAETLENLMQKNDLNPTELARQTGIGQPVIYRILTGETTDPKASTLKLIADSFGVSINYLLGDNSHDKIKARPTKETTLREIPLISWDAISDFTTTTKIKKCELILTDAKTTDTTYALKVKDTTMEPRFTKHTILIVDKALQPKDRDFAIILTKDHQHPIFRQVLFDGNSLYAKPLNPDFKIIQLKKPYQFLGVVIQAKIDLAG